MVAKLAKISNIIGIKEASGDISQVAEIARYVEQIFQFIVEMMISLFQFYHLVEKE